MDGGFDNHEPEYEEFYSIVILPDYVSLPFPSVELPEKVIVVVVLVKILLLMLGLGVEFEPIFIFMNIKKKNFAGQIGCRCYFAC